MADELKNNLELEALMDAPGVNPDEILEQAGIEKETKPRDETPPASDTPPPTPETPPAEEGAGTPPADTGTQPPADENTLLKEIFGDRFKTVEEAKKEVPTVFQQLEDLRREKEELENKLQQKPKTAFADDEIALYNEFVKKTGVKNYDLFRRLSTQDLSQMDDLDKMVLKRVLDNPALIGKEDMVKSYFRKKYGLLEDQYEPEEIEVNKVALTMDATEAAKELQKIKEELKVPEPEQVKEISPEEKAKMSEDWKKVGALVVEKIKTIPLPVTGKKDPLLNFEIPEEQIKGMEQEIANYAVKNGLELNDQNIKAVGNMMYNMAVMANLDKIVKTVFEKARSLTEEEVHALYENPAPIQNNDTPPKGGEPQMTDEEKAQEEIFKAEMERGGF